MNRISNNQQCYRIAPPLRRASVRSYASDSSRGRVLICITLIALLLGIGSLVVNTFSSSLSSGSQLNGKILSSSTPKSEWQLGSIPLLFQTDQAWASQIYAGTPLGESGCGPTCMSMVYVALTGKTDLDPGAMCSYATTAGYSCEEGTDWSFFDEGVLALGLMGEELSLDEDSIKSSIMAGQPIICSMGPGDFTTTGHFIVLVGIDEAGNLVVHDPNSPERSEKHWSFDTIMSQCRNLWAYSAL